MNPFGVIKSELAGITSGVDQKLADLEKRLEHTLEVKLWRDMTIVNLSRLATLDADNSAAYLQAVKDMG